MDVHLLHTVAFGHFQQSHQMVEVAVHAAVGQQADEVQRRAGLFGGGHGVLQRLILKEIAVLNGLGDAGQLLIHDAAGAHVGVADLTVAHLPVRQTHIHTGGADLGGGILGKQPGQVRGLGGLDGVAVGVGVNAEAVHDDES